MLEELPEEDDFFDEDQSKLLESYRNSASAIMIRATPNSVRWDEVNQIKYRFQALNFHTETIDTMFQNSPPLQRRERAQTSPVKKLQLRNSGSDDSNEHSLARNHLATVRRSSSFDSVNNNNVAKRKISVVQVSKDDTSDYNSDEDVFADSRNTTVYHIENSQIRDRTEIRITRSPSLEGAAAKNSDYYVTSERYLEDDETLMSLTREDLMMKSKRELIEIVRQLQSKVQSQPQEIIEDDESKEQKSVSSLVKEFQNQINQLDGLPSIKVDETRKKNDDTEKTP